MIVGDVLTGIDVRPVNNLLYGFTIDSGPGGSNAGVGKVYTINVATGAASLAATLFLDPTDATPPTDFTRVNGSFFGVDFNPVADRLRMSQALLVQPEAL